MRYFLILISSLLLSIHLFAQENKKRRARSSLKDTAYIIVALHDMNYSKTLIINVGEKAKIYLSGDSIINEATQYLSNDFVKNEYSRIITFLDSAFKNIDTVSIEFYKLSNLEHLVSDQLQKGQTKVFYKKHNTFVDTISHRRERFGGNADRFFYLPDKRAFFWVVEVTGIMDNKAMVTGKYYQDYLKEAEKLVGLLQE